MKNKENSRSDLSQENRDLEETTKHAYQIAMREHIINNQDPKLSDEQIKFIDHALDGKNILVDACIGSGKTTSIQALCNIIYPELNVLYLTYNKLLKYDAQKAIKNDNVLVTNYHGFVYPYLRTAHIKSAIDTSIRLFNEKIPVEDVEKYDVVIVDEYQDIKDQFTRILEKIKKANPKAQFIFVGDMSQKIDDTTRLDVRKWVSDFLGDYVQVDFTYSFRISKSLGERIGKVWGKRIVGVNDNMRYKEIDYDTAMKIALRTDTKDLLTLGRKNGQIIDLINELQEINPKKFNKNTMYAKLGENAEGLANIRKNSAIFSSFDASKGMERNVCIVFDYTYSNYSYRRNLPSSDSEIIKNIFLVAASRGKRELYFVRPLRMEKRDKDRLVEAENEDNGDVKIGYNVFETKNLEKSEILKPHVYSPSDMFNHKYTEDVEEAFDLLEKKEIPMGDNHVIYTRLSDGNLNLSPVCGNFASAIFYKNFHVDRKLTYLRDKEIYNKVGDIATLFSIDINKPGVDKEKKKEIIKARAAIKKINEKYRTILEGLEWQSNGGRYKMLQNHPGQYHLYFMGDKYETNFDHDNADIQWELLCNEAAESGLMAYMTQINERYITPEAEKEIIERMKTILDPKEDRSEVSCNLHDIERPHLQILGYIDAIHDGVIYELKFTEELTMIHHLQVATYAAILGHKKCRLWNIKKNVLVEITIPDRQKFMDAVIKCATKGSDTTVSLPDPRW